MTVTTSQVTCICIAMLAGILFPVGTLLFVGKKTGAGFKSFVWGCLIMLLFAMTLESFLHRYLYSTPIGQKIWNSTPLYALYVGLMAGLFEETGRFFAFHFPLKKELDNDANALSYAAGHGGLEAFFILFLPMMNNLTYAMIMKDPDRISQLYESATEEQAEQIRLIFEDLSVTPAWTYLLSILERGSAMLLQFGLTAFVWVAVKKGGKKRWFFPVAIGIHAFVDASMILVNQWLGNGVLTEGYVWICAIVTCLLAWNVWEKELKAN